MNIFSLLSFGISLICLMVGLNVFFIDTKKLLYRYFLALFLEMFIWNFSYTFIYSVYSTENVWLWYRIACIGKYLIPPTIILLLSEFMLQDAYKKKRIVWPYLLFLPSIYYLAKLFFKPFVTENFHIANKMAVKIAEKNTVFEIYYIVVSLGTFIALGIWGIKSKSRRKRLQVGIIIVFSTVALITGDLVDAILAKNYYVIPSIGPLTNILDATGLWIAIAGFKLFEFTPRIVIDDIVSRIQDIVFLVDHSGKVIKASGQLSILGFVPDECVGKPIAKFIKEEDMLKDILDKANIENKSLKETHLTCIAKSGEEIPIRVSGAAVYDSYDDHIGYVIVLRDMRYINQLYIQQKKLKLQNEQLLESEKKLEKMNLILKKRNNRLKNTLNNIGQGLFIVNEKLVVEGEFSRECIEIFNTDISGKSFPELIYPQDNKQQNFIRELSIALLEKDERISKIYATLYPDTIEINSKVYSVKCKKIHMVAKPYIMCVLTDITDKLELERRRKDEESIFRSIVEIITDKEYFSDITNSYIKFAESFSSNCLVKPSNRIIRMVHTFKGVFSQFGLQYISDKLNHVEDELTHAGSKEEKVKLDSEEMKRWLKYESDKIKKYIDIDLLDRDEFITIKKIWYVKIRREIKKAFAKGEYSKISELVDKFNYRSLKDKMKIYPRYVRYLAHKLGKDIAYFSIKGDDVYVSYKIYKRFLQSLTHVFRNAVDHGIESPDERIEIGKEPIGKISCCIKKNHNEIHIIISDDGRGLDKEKLIKSSLEKGIITLDEAANMDNEKAYKLIFKDGVTTKGSVSELSGRGVGMAETAQAVQEINGSIEISSQKGKGTSFIFRIPYLDAV